MSKKRMITKSVIFLLILAFILKIFSSFLSLWDITLIRCITIPAIAFFRSQIIVLMYSPSETAMYTAAFSLSYGGNNRDLPDIPGDSQASVSRKLTNI